MYLSRLLLNPAHPQARRDLASAYELHRSLARAFAPDATTPPARFLWRREADPGGLPGATVLVQSAQPGLWQALGDSALHGQGYFDSLHPNKPVALNRLVQTGLQCRFRVLANPTVTRNGKRYGLHDDEARLAWLRRQGERAGFAVLAAERSASARLRAPQGGRERTITVDTVLFDGLLTVTDAEALQQAWAAGIGPGKAWGLGMLSLAPALPSEVS
jgi:CRISPR system Cascade subunit CasE